MEQEQKDEKIESKEQIGEQKEQAEQAEQTETDKDDTVLETKAEPTKAERSGDTDGTGGMEDSEQMTDISADLRELKKSFPELYSFPELCGLPEPYREGEGGQNGQICQIERYIELRGLGLTPTEAYYATNGERIVERRAAQQRTREKAALSAHLTSIVGQSETPERIMTEREKRAARMALGFKMPDAELERLWRRVHSEQEKSKQI